MCCFVAPTAVAIVTTVVRKKVPEKYKIEWLLLMLWGGVLMSIVDHIMNGEIIAQFPFFTKSFSEMLPEILKVGVLMTAFIFFVWAAMLAGSHFREKKSLIEKTI